MCVYSLIIVSLLVLATNANCVYQCVCVDLQSSLYVSPCCQLCLSVCVSSSLYVTNYVYQCVYSLVSMLPIVFISVCIVYSLGYQLLCLSGCVQCILKNTRHILSSLRSFTVLHNHFRSFLSIISGRFRSFPVVSSHFQSFPVLRDTRYESGTK